MFTTGPRPNIFTCCTLELSQKTESSTLGLLCNLDNVTLDNVTFLRPKYCNKFTKMKHCNISAMNCYFSKTCLQDKF